MERRRPSLLGRTGLGSRGGGSASLDDCLKAFTDDEVMTSIIVTRRYILLD